jgi:hypothetical protein
MKALQAGHRGFQVGIGQLQREGNEGSPIDRPMNRLSCIRVAECRNASVIEIEAPVPKMEISL